MVGKRDIRTFVIIWLNEKNLGEFGILNDISDHVMLVQRNETARNVNHTVSIIECFICDSN